VHKIFTIFSVICIGLFGHNAEAHVDAHISAHIGNTVPAKKIIVLPRYYVVKDNGRIYLPNHYSCYMKKSVKYCTTRKGKALNGIIVNSYDGAVAYENFANGYQNGETLLYTQDGTLISRSYYKNGVKNGKEIVYYVNGNVEWVTRYKKGALDGRVEQYDINGAILGKMTYKKGWFQDGYCKNESKGTPMKDRIKNKRYNEIFPCGYQETE